MNSWGVKVEQIPFPTKHWQPKNPEVKMPVAADVPLDDKQWRKARFPFFPLPDAVTTNVKINIWEDKMRELLKLSAGLNPKPAE